MKRVNDLLDKQLLRASITNITWDRIHLFIDIRLERSEGFESEKPLDFYAVNEKGAAKVHFDTQITSEDSVRLHTNISNPGYNCALQNGVYTIYICQGTSAVAECLVDQSMVHKLEEVSRNFLYGGRGRSYTVTFEVSDMYDDKFLFNMIVLGAKERDRWPVNPVALNETDEKNPTMLDPLFRDQCEGLKAVMKTDKLIRLAYFVLSKVLPKPKKTILFMSEQNATFRPNQKAVYDRMVERGLDKEYKILFSFRAATKGNHMGAANWISVISKLLRSSLVILDDHAPILDWLELSKHTKVVQLWHAGAGFKSSGYSRWGHKGCPAPFSCHRQYTYGIAGSRKIAHFFSEVWGINTEQVLPTGMPRMDEYNDETHKAEKVKELYEQFPQCKGKKVILFAPTYRGKNQFFAYYPYELIDFEKFYKVCGDEYVCLFKMHPWVSQPVPIEDRFKDKFIDVNNYPSINDLFYITDLMITDYSSGIFEYSLRKNPMLFFAFDEVQYSFSRGFHRPYRESAPGKVVTTFEELLTAIENKDFEHHKVLEYVEHHFDYVDSGACDRIIDWIILGNMPEEFRSAINNKLADAKAMSELSFPIRES